MFQLGTWAGRIQNILIVTFVSAPARQGAKMEMAWICRKFPMVGKEFGITKRVRCKRMVKRDTQVLKKSGNTAIGGDVELGVPIPATKPHEGNQETSSENGSNTPIPPTPSEDRNQEAEPENGSNTPIPPMTSEDGNQEIGSENESHSWYPEVGEIFAMGQMIVLLFAI
jgi:hypothetical protein